MDEWRVHGVLFCFGDFAQITRMFRDSEWQKIEIQKENLGGPCPIGANAIIEYLTFIEGWTVWYTPATMDANKNLIGHNWDFVQSLFPIGWEDLARKIEIRSSIQGWSQLLV
ncbi:MAG: hypothetical protein HQL84_02575 [Magnetococcales bacterium]|nr:hypothetical protein [Magnetococcales bacterium]MBF0148911.1 hypothetical protein [Magnetococcales bacterium]MBF0347601.1 hypothetical protein [Magnetococcales bacterium]MBF0630110.1 hypothetical protein [Magnetococcales bacterium]